MRDLDADFISEKNKSANRPIFLYTLYEYDGVNNLYMTSHDANVTYPATGSPQVYTRFPIKHEHVTENSDGQIDTVKIRVGNVNRVFQSYLETYDLRGKKAEITMVFADKLNDAAANMIETFYIDSYTAGDEVIEFTLSSQFDIQDVQIPQRKFLRHVCQWKFKSAECGYSGGETTCNKTKFDCKTVKNNFLRFGGFPSIPQHKSIIR